MGQEFKASVQYDDLKGFVALDGHDGVVLTMLAKHSQMPAGYFPVGFELQKLSLEPSGMIGFQIVAVKIADTGGNMNEINTFAKANAEVAVYAFDGEIDPATLSGLFKRFNLTAILKGLAGFNVVKYEA